MSACALAGAQGGVEGRCQGEDGKGKVNRLECGVASSEVLAVFNLDSIAII
jgi:hypothetical protein